MGCECPDGWGGTECQDKVTPRFSFNGDNEETVEGLRVATIILTITLILLICIWSITCCMRRRRTYKANDTSSKLALTTGFRDQPYEEAFQPSQVSPNSAMSTAQASWEPDEENEVRFFARPDRDDDGYAPETSKLI